MNIQVSVPDWVKLPHETRLKLADLFQIPKSKGSQMEQIGNESILKSDGHTHEDLSHISIRKMQSFLHSTEADFATLFNRVVAKIEEDKELEIKETVIDVKQLLLEEWVAVLQRLKGQAVEKDMQPHLVETVKRIFEIKSEPNGLQRPPDKAKKAK